MKKRTIHVLTADFPLRRALLAHIAGVRDGPEVAAEVPGLAHPAPGDVAVVPATECSPQQVASLAGRGVNVIVLAAIPREHERLQYLEGGAASYLPMTVGSDVLLREVERLARADRAAIDM
jgi:CheY-like chemotaxis protein